MFFYPGERITIEQMAVHTYRTPTPEKSWLNLGKWTAKENLLLLSGINPHLAVVNWDLASDGGWCHEKPLANGVTYSGKLLMQEVWQRGRLIGHEGDPAFPTVSNINIIVENLLAEMSSNEKTEAIKISSSWYNKNSITFSYSERINDYLQLICLRKAYEKAETLLIELFGAWQRRKDAEQAFDEQKIYSVEYHLRWVKSNEFFEKIPWWNNAIRQGYISNSKINNNVAQRIQNDAQFRKGRKNGANGKLFNFLLEKYEVEILENPKLTTRQFWKAIPEERFDNKTGPIAIVEKLEETNDSKTWRLNWQHENNSIKSIKYSSFQKIVTKIRKQ